MRGRLAEANGIPDFASLIRATLANPLYATTKYYFTHYQRAMMRTAIKAHRMKPIKKPDFIPRLNPI